ncbi:MAG: Fe(3+) ABC transporter substrate-binding protein [Hyphomicrobiaceae bacterium]|nr:Fe(3+) ABC transporter substrate-binding protein [Hyphomicrobiaceae bacterium]
MKILLSAAGIAAIAMSSGLSPASAGQEVNLYSYRQPFLIKPMLKGFTKKTGIKVNVVYAKKGMLERIKAEGENTPADAVLTTDVGRLSDMVDAGVLASVKSDVLNKNIPAQYRHPDGLWFAQTTRARILFTSKERVKPGEVTSYEDLADPRLKGRICIRSGKHLYNISLIASMIAHKGQAAAEKWLTGVKNNLARRPQGNDRAQARAVYEGVCDIGLANTYYMGKMQTNEKKPVQKKWAAALNIVFPNQADRGTHVNISGAAVLKHAKHKANAIKLLEYLSENTAQKIYAKQNYEYPVKPGVPLSLLVESWGTFKSDSLNLAEISKHRAQAAKMVDRVGFDH